MAIEVVQYVTPEGDSPFAEWFNGLDNQAARKVLTAIDRMVAGNFGDSRGVGKGVIERRVHWGPGYRIYFGRDGDRIVVLLAGGTKKRQTADIAQAQAYWEDYRRRSGEN